MTYSTITDDFHYDTLADNIVAREMEVYSYDMNISNYQIMLEALPIEDWPDELAQYKTTPLEYVPDELDQIVSEHQYRDRLKSLLKTERAERNKSFRLYEAMIARLPEANRLDLITAAKARLTARMNTA